MGMKFKNLFKDNKYFIYLVVIFFIGSIFYWVSRGKNNNYENKEVVNIVLPNSEITETLHSLVEEFNLENKDIEINFESYETDYINVAITKIVNSRDIDIFEYFDRFLIDKEEIECLDNLDIDFSKTDKDAIVKFNNDVIGVRYGESAPKMIVNKEILDKAGIKDFKSINTFEELITIASTIKETVPGVTPIGMSTTNIDEACMIFGTPSAMNSMVYPTFWNYEKGKYTFNEAEETLDIYRNLYIKGLINDDFNTKEYVDNLDDFSEGKVAITFINLPNDEFLVENTDNINMSVQDMPGLKNNDLNKRYYNSGVSTLVVRNYDKPVDNLTNENISDMKSHKKAVKEVYEWLLSDKVKSRLTNSGVNLGTSNVIDVNNEFKYGEFDPTTFITIDKNIIRDTFTELIKGEDDINSELIKLEDSINTAVKNNEETIKTNLEMYKE